MSKKYICSLSGGKDSTAMLLMLIEKNYPLDEVVFFDTGWEFQAIYETLNKLKIHCENKCIKFTILTSESPFNYLMFEHTFIKRNGDTQKGYSWCGGRCRWGTTQKTKTLDRYCKDSIVYVGIAADEPDRLKKLAPNKRAPLAEWGVTEAEALEHCYKNGFEFKEYIDYKGYKAEHRLYDLLDRVSCWCCGNKNLKELRNIYLYMPNYWAKLKEYQSRTDRPFRRDGKTIFDLEKRFEKECKFEQNTE